VAEHTGKLARDSAVSERSATGCERVFDAEVSPDWRAGRGPHGGYIAAMILRALCASVADGERAPRSVTIHYARAPEPGPVTVATKVEREGRSLSTLSARMEQEGKLMALVLAAFSRAWSGPDYAEEPIPAVAPPDAERVAGSLTALGAPPFTEHLVLQHRIGKPFAGDEEPMEIGGWIGLAEPEPIDAPTVAFFTDALIPAPFTRTRAAGPAPTVDLTVHFAVPLPRPQDGDAGELCLARTSTRVIHEGFFVEDGMIWARDGTLIAKSRQLAILLHASMG
jgi:acyl-CoA thioesterase